jgi:hypothetical protein
LNGGGRFCEALKIDNIYDASEQDQYIIALTLNQIVEGQFLEDNKLGITSMDQTENWSWQKLENNVSFYVKSYFY